jgi:ribosomal-protein-alanine N-acetyltransferase
MNIRTLQADDAERLLAFELENRAWFEQHVEARGDAFYTPDGVAAHIADYLRDYAAGVMHPCVLIDDDGAVIGRANLRRIDKTAGSGEVGYRIAHSHARKGLASGALEHLQQLARERYGLRMLNAWIAEENLGSRRVMEKCHFSRATLTPSVAVTVHGILRESHLYQCHL